jgi:MSHA biogenesis protein MshL
MTVSTRPAVFLLAALLSACAAGGGAQTRQQIENAMAEARALPSTPPPEVSAALIPPAPLADPAELAYREPRFDVAVENIPARAFFMSLAADSPYNVVVSNALEGYITLQLKSVTLPQVMDVMRDAFGYEYRLSGNTYTVQPPSLRTQVFEIDYLNLTRTGMSRTRISSGQSTESGQSSNMQQGGMFPVVTDAPTSQQVSGTRIETDSEAAFWEDLKQSLLAMVGSEDGRNVVVNAQNGVVVVRALPAELRTVEDVLRRMQNIAQRQVILEAKIIEVELRDGFQAGIDWAYLKETSRAGAAGYQHRNASAGEAPARLSDLGIGNGVFEPFNPTRGLGSRPFGGAFSAALYYRNFNAFVELLETQGRTQVLSSPRVATVNNQKAVIKVGSDEFFVTGVTSQTTTGGASSNSNRNIILTPFFSGIALDVTPQISANGEVILHIHPTVSEVTDQTKSFTVGGLEESLPLALSSVRESDSVIRTRSGDVVVIGGMMKDSSSSNSGGIPGLARIPGLGNLFKRRSESGRKSELVILLRATVINSEEDWHREGVAADERLRALSEAGGAR